MYSGEIEILHGETPRSIIRAPDCLLSCIYISFSLSRANTLHPKFQSAQYKSHFSLSRSLSLPLAPASPRLSSARHSFGSFHIQIVSDFDRYMHANMHGLTKKSLRLLLSQSLHLRVRRSMLDASTLDAQERNVLVLVARSNTRKSISRINVSAVNAVQLRLFLNARPNL